MATYQGVDIDLEPTEDMRREARIGPIERSGAEDRSDDVRAQHDEERRRRDRPE